MRFAGVIVRKGFLDAGFILPRRLDHPRIRTIVAYTPHAYGHHVEIRSRGDLDDELVGWLRESYRVGQQLHLLAGKKAPLRTEGDFAWSEPSFAASGRARTDPRIAPASSRVAARKRQSPVWRCSKCGRTFANRNQRHICSRITLAGIAGR